MLNSVMNCTIILINLCCICILNWVFFLMITFIIAFKGVGNKNNQYFEVIKTRYFAF